MKDFIKLRSFIVRDVADQRYLSRLLTQIGDQDLNLAHSFKDWIHWLLESTPDLDVHQCASLRYQASKLATDQPIAVLTSYWPSEDAARYKRFTEACIRELLRIPNPVDVFPLGRWSMAAQYSVISMVSHSGYFVIHDDSHWLTVPANVLATFLTRKIYACDVIREKRVDQIVSINTNDNSLIRRLLQENQ